MSGADASPPFEPLYLSGGAGRLFAVFHPPGPDPRGAVLYLPPFGEELNCARRQAAMTARALARAGHAVLVLDPFGTGDSEGEFADARWAIWRDDVARATEWLRERAPGPLILLGLRLGAALAVATAALAERLALWQPVTDGGRHLDQILRLRVAAGLAGGTRETTRALRDRLAAGESLEIAGYTLHPELAAAIEAVRLEALAPGRPTEWFELAGDAEAADIGPASARVVAAWREAGTEVRTHVVAGEPFWRIQETTLAPALTAATVAALARE